MTQQSADMASYCKNNVGTPYQDHSKNPTLGQNNYHQQFSLQYEHFQSQQHHGLRGEKNVSQDARRIQFQGRTYKRYDTPDRREANVTLLLIGERPASC